MLIPFYLQLPFEQMRQLNNDVKIVHEEIQKMIDYKNKIRIKKGKEHFTNVRLKCTIKSVIFQ